MFNQVIMTVLGFLGISAFAKDNAGKSILLSTQENDLKNKYGEKFVEEFKKDLAEFEKNGSSVAETKAPTAEELAQMQADSQALIKAKAEIKNLKEAQAGFEAKIATLEKSPAGDKALETVQTQGEKVVGYKPDMSLGINKTLDAAYHGKVLASSYTGDDTINTEELKTEFGRYVSSEKMEIFRSLMGTTSSLVYMSTMITDKMEVKASHAHITSVLQSFVPKWTPKGTSTFTPMVIKQYLMKINVSIIPSDIIDDVLGYLYDEKLDPKDMPIVKYVIEKLVKPVLDEEREIALAKGIYKEPESDGKGSFVANDANSVCDGYLTQLCRLKNNSSAKVTFLLDGEELGEGDTLLENIDKAVDAVAPLYKNKKMFIHADPDLIIKYSRAYRNKYPNTKNEDGEKVKVDFTNFTFAGLEGMRGTGAFFITPKENFRHLMSQDPKNQRLRMATQDYEAKIYGEWREGVGFWLQEAIFAYLPDDLVDELAPSSESAASGSDSGSKSGSASGSNGL